MNRKQIQIEVCKAFLNPNNRVAYSEINAHEIAVTATGFDAFVFDKNEIIFDVSKIRKIETLKSVLADCDTDEPIKPTGEMFKENGKLIAKLTSESFELFADSTLMGKFSEYQLFANSPTERILAKDRFGRLVGCFLPYKMR